MKYMLSLDQSTAQTKLLLVDADGRIAARAQKAHRTFNPRPGWAEQDAEEIWQNVCLLLRQMMQETGLKKQSIEGLSLTNQRETTVAWDRCTGRPLTLAVGWQCQRGADICQNLAPHAEMIRRKTGLLLSPYYPAAKAAWLWAQNETIRQKAAAGELCFGTIDSYLIFRLTAGAVFATDASNASRTQWYNLAKGDWDEKLLRLFAIPRHSLAEIRSSDAAFGLTAAGLLPWPLQICGVLGDSHAALWAQGCIQPGLCKATYGTGSSLMVHIGAQPSLPPPGISGSVAWRIGNRTEYVLEGNVTCSGDTLIWLRDTLQLVDSIFQINKLAASVPDAGGVYLIPAFAGLGAPYFDSQAQAAILGMQRCTGKAHVARAALESIAYQNGAVLAAIDRNIEQLHADGGASQSDLLMQFQADLIQCPVIASQEHELSALGAAYMGGIKLGLYDSIASILAARPSGRTFTPKRTRKEAKIMLQGWQKAVARVRN